MAALSLIASVALLVGILSGLHAARENRSTAPPAWWSGHVRDAIHLIGTSSISLAYFLAGMTGPHALVLGVSAALGMYLVHESAVVKLGRPRAMWMALGVGLVFVLPAMVAAPALESAMSWVMQTLFS